MRSNTYVLMFTATVTIVLGFLLSLASTSLNARQELNIENDKRKNILRSLNMPEDTDQKLSPDEIQTLFDNNIKTIHIDTNGNPDPEGSLVVYEKLINGKIDGYSIPISGKGLWSTLYGYFALEPDGKTVKGITFYKHGETPGLGGEVEKEWFTSNFVGKRVVNQNGNLVSITVVKGEVKENDPERYHKVDGISGATMTSRGLNQFLEEDLATYDPFLQKVREGEIQ